MRKGETAKSDHRYPDGHLQESSLTCWMSMSFQRNKFRFISSFFMHVSSGCFFRQKLSNTGAHLSHEDLRSWGTAKTSKVNHLASLMRNPRPRMERNLPEVHSRTGSIPDTSVCPSSNQVLSTQPRSQVYSIPWNSSIVDVVPSK